MVCVAGGGGGGDGDDVVDDDPHCSDGDDDGVGLGLCSGLAHPANYIPRNKMEKLSSVANISLGGNDYVGNSMDPKSLNPLIIPARAQVGHPYRLRRGLFLA
jgi:hypothetical protein